MPSLPAHDFSGEESAHNAGDPGSGRSPGEGNGNPVQYSCLENPMEPSELQSTDHQDSDTIELLTLTFLPLTSKKSAGSLHSLSPLECRRKEALPSGVLALLPPTLWEEPHMPGVPCTNSGPPSVLVGSGIWKWWGGGKGAGAGFLAPQAINLSPSLTPQPSWKEETPPFHLFTALLSLLLHPDATHAGVTNKCLVAKLCAPFQTLPHSLESKILLSKISSWKLPHPRSSQNPKGPMPVFRGFRQFHQPGPP